MISMLCVSGALVNTKTECPQLVRPIFVLFHFTLCPHLCKLTLINSSQGQKGIHMHVLFSSFAKLPTGEHIIIFMNNSGGFAIYISWFRRFGLKITPYHCNHKSFDLPFSWDKREMITAIFLPTEGFTLMCITNHSWQRLHLLGKLTFIAAQLKIKSISLLPSHHVISLEMVNRQ